MIHKIVFLFTILVYWNSDTSEMLTFTISKSSFFCCHVLFPRKIAYNSNFIQIRLKMLFLVMYLLDPPIIPSVLHLTTVDIEQ